MFTTKIVKSTLGNSEVEKCIKETIAKGRFAEAAQVLAALEPLPMPDSTGPIARADRTVVPAPRAAGRPAPDLPSLRSPADPVPAADPTSMRRSRAEAREQGAEGGLWPVVLALALSALAGTAIGWYVLTRGASRDTAPSTSRDVVGRSQGMSLPPAEVDERQKLLSRLRALQVDRTWFLKLVDSSLLARFPERGGRLPSDSLEDAPLRRVWNDLAEEWLARIAQLPPGMRSRLGQLKETDWRKQRQDLVSQGVNGTAVEQLVSAGARALLPGAIQDRRPEEPYRPLRYAAAGGHPHCGVFVWAPGGGRRTAGPARKAQSCSRRSGSIVRAMAHIIAQRGLRPSSSTWFQIHRQ